MHNSKEWQLYTFTKLQQCFLLYKSGKFTHSNNKSTALQKGGIHSGNFSSHLHHTAFGHCPVFYGENSGWQAD